MNCRTCKYAILDDRADEDVCVCTIHVLSTKTTFTLKGEQINMHCPCHSDLTHEETRFGYQIDRKQSEDVCEMCQRFVDKNDNLNIINKNKTTKKRICTICETQYNLV